MPHRRKALAGLMGAAALLGMGAVGPDAHAQEVDPTQTGEALFGTYALEARGIGVETRYEVEGLLPGGAPVLDLTIPETLARHASGPSGYGLASLAYPGGIIINLRSLIEASGSDGSFVPPYPIKAEAFYPSGPVEENASQGGGEQHVTTGPLGVDAVGSFPAVEAGPLVQIGDLDSASRTVIEEGKAVSRTRVVASDVVILGGVVTIDSIVTDLVAAHDGTSGASDGGTRASGVRFLGLDAAFTDDGLVLAEAPPAEGPAGPLGDVLDPVSGPLADAAKPVQDAIAQVFEQATPQVDDLLAQAGVTITVAQPEDVEVASGAVTRTSAGVTIGMTYKGREQEELGQLIDSIPAELKPNLGPIPFPIAFFAENHITGFNVGPATVSALATPPFDVPPFADVPLAPTVPGSFDPGTAGDLAAPSFETPVPDIPASNTAVGGLVPASSPLDGALPAFLVLAVIVLSPLFGMGSTKLADNVLAPVSTSCPTGHDRPDIYDPAPGRLT
jgi:hypothetical protein